MFAVVKTGGKQYHVLEKDLLKIEKIEGNVGDKISLTEILMVGEGADVKIGAPCVEGAAVKAEIVAQGRARKVIAFKKRRRKNSKRIRGHRQEITTIRILEIASSGAKAGAKAKSSPKKNELAAEQAEA